MYRYRGPVQIAGASSPSQQILDSQVLPEVVEE